MTYLMSDLHGETSAFVRMLRKIDFHAEDVLYILGDVIDRCPSGVTLLQWVMAAPNMVLLKGNHEAMMLDAYASEGNVSALRHWLACGGDVTFHRMEQLVADEREEILRYVHGLPEEAEVCVNGRVFHLVHGRPGTQSLQRLWQRPCPSEVFFLDKTVVIGHTPTVCFDALTKDGMQKIFFDHGFIDIDCGCGRMYDRTRRMACLRLDGMQEFYI